MITTGYEKYDRVTGLKGTLGHYASMLQLIPVEEPGEATSSGNVAEPLELTLADLAPEHQAMLVIICGVLIDPGHHLTSDESGEGILRTPHFNAALA